MIGWILSSILYLEGSVAALGFFALHVKHVNWSDTKVIGLALTWVLFWPILTPIFLSLVLYTLLGKKRKLAANGPADQSPTNNVNGSNG